MQSHTEFKDEARAVQAYRENSEIFKNFEDATNHLSFGIQEKELEMLNEAKTFDELIDSCCIQINPRNSYLKRKLTSSINTIGSFFSYEPSANFYAFQLKEDIIKFATDSGFNISPSSSNRI